MGGILRELGNNLSKELSWLENFAADPKFSFGGLP